MIFQDSKPLCRNLGLMMQSIQEFIGSHLSSLFFISTADWLLFWAYYQKSQEKLGSNKTLEVPGGENLGLFSNESTINQQDLAWNDNIRTFFELRFANLLDYCIPAFCVSYFFFFAIGGYLHVSISRERPSEASILIALIT